jgi:hypothetical protein
MIVADQALAPLTDAALMVERDGAGELQRRVDRTLEELDAGE